MLARIRRNLTYANVMATVAAFLAVGGGAAYAANTVFSRDIVNGQVKTADLADGAASGPKLAANAVSGQKVASDSLTGADVDEATLSVPSGYAQVTAAGAVTADRDKGIVAVQKPAGTSGVYCFNLTATPTHAVASPFAVNNAVTATAVNGDIATPFSDCGAGHRDAVVRTYAAQTGTPTDVSFSVVFVR